MGLCNNGLAGQHILVFLFLFFIFYGDHMLSCHQDIYGLVRQFSVSTLSGKFNFSFLHHYEAFDIPSILNDLFHFQLNEGPGGSSLYSHGNRKGY